VASFDWNQPLTPDLIRQLLKDDLRAKTPSAYVRLMEIYCVVRGGGAAAQIEAAYHLEQTERSLLLKDIEALTTQPDSEGRIRALQQEIWELERSTASRVHYLRGIDLQEEANVRSCLADINSYFEH
jgi:hypothetical protein